MLENKKILLGLTGCIAAYKACEIIRLLQKQGAEVRVMATSAALKFITPLTLQTLSQHKVYSALFDELGQMHVKHISLARWADMILIAPATANTIAKLNYGIADNLLTSVCLATRAKIAIAPAMNCVMWDNQKTQENIRQLKGRGFDILNPIKGKQACDEVGVGNMMKPVCIVKRLMDRFSVSPLAGKTILITTGPTCEPLDPVRFLSNQSSGKMGFALAEAAIALGMKVTLISGPTSLSAPFKAQVIDVQTAQQMYEAVMSLVQKNDIFVSAAAVADYQAVTIHQQKIKKQAENIQMALKKTPDILNAVSQLSHRRPFVVGFAAETQELEKNAFNKLKAKNLDMIVANDVSEHKAFNQDTNAVTILTQAKKRYVLSEQGKLSLAYEFFRILANVMSPSLIQFQHHKEANSASTE
jgi:phosphopantothenoylcysteine decarboxylase/phosphopantothenate--cysteine ligase